MLLYYLSYDYYLLCSHCERGWEYEDEGETVPSIKKLLYNSTGIVSALNICCNSPVKLFRPRVLFVGKVKVLII